MLVLKLKKQDRVTIGNLVLEIKEVSAGRVRMAMQAPRDVLIHNESAPELVEDWQDDQDDDELGDVVVLASPDED